MNDQQFVYVLKEACPQLDIKVSVPLAEHTFIRMGGIADLYVQPSTMEEVQNIAQLANKYQIPLIVLGFGTNIIIRDGGIRGVVMNMNRLKDVQIEANVITVQCGASLIEVSRMARDHHLSGLEFACGIPGSIGGALIMNAGAYGGEISFVLKQAKALSRTGKLVTLQEGEFDFGYRSSIFEKEGYTVLEAVFQLEKGDLSRIQEQMDHFTFLREQKQPLEYPSCGSVFKRPPNLFAGKLIQDSGLQGFRIGGAEVSTKHAGFIVNIDHATSTDYLRLIEHVKETVKEKFNVELETEVKIIGELNPPGQQPQNS